jgi:aryl-phospho-beta-D-glucosidase BglC (GH1 family)
VVQHAQSICWLHSLIRPTNDCGAGDRALPCELPGLARLDDCEKNMICRILVALAVLAACSSPGASDDQPRWRGFNLLEKFKSQSCEPFRENDFRLISKLGFNFVRLPLDYRCWIVDGDWERLKESQLREIDQALEFGRRHSIHVCINFHRAPGYTVAQPPEARSVWTDPEALRVCSLHWRTFARRYKDIPREELSFNLFNEPKDVSLAQFLHVTERLVEVIRAESPDRLIISDGLQWGQMPHRQSSARKSWLSGYKSGTKVAPTRSTCFVAPPAK